MPRIKIPHRRHISQLPLSHSQARLHSSSPTAEEIRQQTKIESMTKYLGHSLCIDKCKLQASFYEHSIVDMSIRLVFSGEPVHDNRLARLRLFDGVVQDFLQDNEAWIFSQVTSFLALKEYAPGETRARVNHELFATHMVKQWHKPDLAIHIMYPIEDPNSEIEGDYLLRAFTTQLGGAMLKKYYDQRFEDELLKVETSQTPNWYGFLRVLIAKLELEGRTDRRIRIFVVLHGARVEQAVHLARTIRDMAGDWLAPIFLFLISGEGADKVAEGIGCQAFELAYPDEYYVRLRKVEPPASNHTEGLNDLAAQKQLKLQGDWQCDVWRIA